MTLALVDGGLPWAFIFSAAVLGVLVADFFLLRFAIRERSVATWAATLFGVLLLTAFGLAAAFLDLIVIGCPPTGCFGD